MATNNSLNNNFANGLNILGATSINTTGSGTTTIGTLSSSNVSFASGSASTVTLNSKNLIIDSGGSDINIGTDATAKTISLTGTGSFYIGLSFGNIAASTTNLTFSSATTNSVSLVNNVGNISINNTATGSINIGTVSSESINIGTVSGSFPIQIGNTNSTSSLTILAGSSGGVNIGTTGTPIINIGNSTGATSVSLCNAPSSVITVNYPNVNITSSTANLSFGLYHIINSGASLCTITLPTTCPLGSLITVVGFASGGWTIAQNTGQQIFSTASSTTISSGTLSSGGRYDCVQIECVVANTTWVVKSFKGTLTFA